MRLLALASVLVPFVFVTGCGAYTYPRRPRPATYVSIGDRAGTLLVTCPDNMGDCYQRAAQACPAGYDSKSASVPVRGFYASNRRFGVGRDYQAAPGSLLITCDSDRSPMSARCDRAWTSRAEAARWWATHAAPERSARAKDDVPEGLFRRVCEGLPEPVQSCLATRYRERHAASCDGAAGALGPSDVALLDLTLVKKGE